MGIYSEQLPGAMAEQLRAEKAVSELTYAQIAEQLEVHEQSVIRYLKGQRDIPMSVIYKLAEVFDIDPIILMQRAVDRLKK